jgi:hypothetical protein
MPHPRGRTFTTRQAADYLRELGVEGSSVRTLIRQRMRGPDDPGDQGPDFYRRPTGKAIYFKVDLDQYAERRKKHLVFRGPAAEPKQLQRSNEAA